MFNKKIIIKSERDLDKFYKKLKYYKLSLFTKFESDNKNIQDIITALNIKNRNKRIIYIYDYVCNYIDNFWNGKNYCGFKNNKCYCQQQIKSKYINGCCRLCLYQSIKGCKTNNLTCKFYYCTEVCKRYRVLTYEDIKILNLFSSRQRIIIKHSFFNSREQILFDLKYSFLLIFAFKVLLRHVFRILYLKFRDDDKS